MEAATAGNFIRWTSDPDIVCSDVHCESEDAICSPADQTWIHQHVCATSHQEGHSYFFPKVPKVFILTY